MKFLDLFAGIGGFRLGMEQAGHECVGYVEWDKFARKSYQAIHDTTNEWTAIDINEVNATDIPRANIWCFGFLCQDISLAGKQKGITNGKQSSLFFTVTGLIRQLKEEDRPELLFIENVKNLLSINRGWDFAKLQIELDEIGYNCEWDVLNSKEVVPQNRERIFIIGHLRGKRTRKVFPITRESGETVSTNEIKVIGNTSETGYRSHDVLDPTGLSTMLMSRDYKGPKQIAVNQLGNISDSDSFGGNPQTGRRFKTDGDPEFTLTAQDRHGVLTNVSQGVKVEAKPAFGRFGQQAADTMNANEVSDFDIIEPFNHRVHKDQVSPTLTTRPEGLKTAILPVTNNLRIRKLTPLECWRLQGFPDWAFDKAKKAGISNSQLYKQAGNSVTVPVIYEIADRMGYNDNRQKTGKIVKLEAEK